MFNLPSPSTKLFIPRFSFRLLVKRWLDSPLNFGKQIPQTEVQLIDAKANNSKASLVLAGFIPTISMHWLLPAIMKICLHCHRQRKTIRLILHLIFLRIPPCQASFCKSWSIQIEKSTPGNSGHHCNCTPNYMLIPEGQQPSGTEGIETISEFQHKMWTLII